MDKKSKIFILVFFLIIVVSVGITYWRIMVKRDYIVEAQTDCDPYSEACFVWKCDPNSTVEDEACTGAPEKDIWYYKIVRRNAGRIPLCDPNTDENCQALVCGENEPQCEEILCNDKNKVSQGVECNDPVIYTEENPIEEDSVQGTPTETDNSSGTADNSAGAVSAE